jgi:hypothetical protein
MELNRTSTHATLAHGLLELVYFPGHNFSCLEKFKKLSGWFACQKILDGLKPDVYTLLDRKVLADTRGDDYGTVIRWEILKFRVLRQKHELL